MISNAIRVLDKGILFTFIENIRSKGFENKTDWGFTVTDRVNDPKYPRWGKVLSIGKDVTETAVGDYILIESLQWTTELKYKEDSFWKTNEASVMIVSKDEPQY